MIIALRKELDGQGLDAGPQTICWHLEHHHGIGVPAATVSRYLTARQPGRPLPPILVHCRAPRRHASA